MVIQTGRKNHVNHILSHFTVHEPNEQINQIPITFHNNVSIGCNIFPNDTWTQNNL
jgi:hypothetical protein